MFLIYLFPEFNEASSKWTMKTIRNIILISPVVTLELRASEIKILNLDCTFKVVPHPFYQLLTIQGTYRGEKIVIAYALLGSKNTRGYLLTLEALVKMFPDLNPDYTMSDFEAGLINALKTVFPCATHKGCTFHYQQAIYRKMGDPGNYFLIIITQNEGNFYIPLFLN